MNGTSVINEALRRNRECPLSADELKGFGPKPKPRRTVKPYIRISGPDKEDGPKGWKVEIGVKGTF